MAREPNPNPSPNPNPNPNPNPLTPSLTPKPIPIPIPNVSLALTLTLGAGADGRETGTTGKPAEQVARDLGAPECAEAIRRSNASRELVGQAVLLTGLTAKVRARVANPHPNP